METVLERSFILSKEMDPQPETSWILSVLWVRGRVVVPQSLLWSFIKMQVSILETYLPGDSHSR